MKRLLFIPLLCLLAACGGEDEPKSKVLDPFARIYVHIKENPVGRSADNPQRLSPREMLEQARYFQQFQPGDVSRRTRSIGDNEKDFEKLAFIWWGDDVVRADTIVTYWRDARDLIILTRKGDTIGYIPQHIRNEAFERILEAEKRKDYDLIYKIFHEAFTGIPCTAEEYKELKAKGLN